MKTLFVTSFDLTLFEASGKRLLKSFQRIHLQACPDDQILCCIESGIDTADENPAVKHYDLDHDKFLHNWLRAYADIIPDYLGGKATKCDCPDTEKRHAKHKHGCHWQWMNRNASRWFRKVASLNAAYRVAYPKEHEPAYDFLVWLDADTYFKAPLPHTYLDQKLRRKQPGGTTLLDTANMFYFRGHRPAIESGILAFRLTQQRGTAKILSAIFERYMCGRFKQDERWDDGYQITKIVESLPSMTDVVPVAIDLVHPTKYKTGPHRTNDVIPTTDIAVYLVHEKGRHGTGLDIMK